MNNKDILDALSGIDPKYIDEAAFELHGGENRTADVVSEEKETAKVVDITSRTSKRRIGRFVKVVLPSVAAILLIVGVALPAVLRVGKSESAMMSDAAAPMAEAPAADEAVSEAPAAGAEEPAVEEAAPMAEEAEAAAETATYDRDTTNPDEVHNYKNEEPLAVRPPESEEAAEAAPEEPWVIKEADFSRNILIIRCGGTIPQNLADLPFTLERTDVSADKAKIKDGAKLSELFERIEVTDNWIVMSLSSGSGLRLEKGSYRLFIGDAEVEFEVK